MTDAEQLWRDRLDGVTSVRLGRGLDPDRLADRYDAATRAEIHDLTNQAFKEVIRGGNSVMTLDDLDVAAEKLDALGDHEVVTDGGQPVEDTEQAAETPDRVWRIVWTNAHLRHKTDWTIHYDKVRELYDDYREMWPGAEVEMQSANIDSVSGVRTMDFGEGRSELERIPTEGYESAAEALADITGRPREEFESDDYDLPDLEDLDVYCAACDASVESLGQRDSHDCDGGEDDA